MRRHAKASSAGSTSGTGSSRGLFGRALATRGACGDAEGIGAPSDRRPAAVISSLGLALLLALALIPSIASATQTRVPLAFSPITGAGSGFAIGTPGGIAVDEASGNVFLNDGTTLNDILDAEGGSPAGLVAPFQLTGFSFTSVTNGVAVDNSATSPSKGTLYVVNTAGKIKKFTRNVLTEKYEAAGELSYSATDGNAGAAVDTHGNLFVAQFGSQSVFKFNPAGTQVAQFNLASSVVRPTSVAVDAAGDLFAVRAGQGAYKYPADGSGEIEPAVFTQILPTGATGVAVDPATNRLFIALGNRVAQYDATTLAKQLEFGVGTLTTTTRLAVNSATDRIYVSDNGTGKKNVAVFGPPVTVPTVNTNAASGITGTKATLNAIINPEGVEVTECKFEYGPTTAYGSSKPCEGALPTDSSNHPVTAAIAGLTPNGATYHFRVVAKNANGTSSGADRTLVTGATVFTGAATAVTTTAATLNGVVRPEGAPVTECKFEYGTTSVYGSSKPCTPAAAAIDADFEAHAVSAGLTGLATNTTYHFRLVATGGSGTFAGQDQVFTTPGPPQITEGLAQVERTTAELIGAVNPSGFATTYHFEWGTSTAYGARIPADFDLFVGSGNEPVELKANLSGLALNTTYHFRLVATNSSGTTIGSDHDFVTPNAVGLPDNRAFEQVSVPDKRPQGAVECIFPCQQLQFQAADAGNSFVYPINNGLADIDSGGAMDYLASRSPDRWISSKVNSPSLIPSPNEGLGSRPSAIHGFSDDLSCAVLESFNPLTADTPKASVELGVTNLYRRNPNGSFTLLTPTVPSNPGGLNIPYYVVAGVSSDCSRVYFATGYNFLPSPSGLYEWANGTLSDAGALPNGAAGAAAKIGGGLGGDPNTSAVNSVSRGGTSFVFSATSNQGLDAGKTAVFVRRNGVSVDASQTKTGVAPRGARYEISSPGSGDGSHVHIFFTANYGLTPSSSSGSTTSNCTSTGSANELCDLYDYDVDTGQLQNLSADSNPADSSGAVVQGVVDVSRDGSYVYFVAKGQLVPGKGATYAQNLSSGGGNLYLAHDGTLTFIAVVGAADVALASERSLILTRNADPSGSSAWSAQATPDGQHLLFSSKANITGYASGGAEEAYLYSAGTESIVCISCRRDGKASVVSTDGTRFPIQGPTNSPYIALYFPRAISDDGNRVFFKSKDPLAPGAVEGNVNLYEWERGQVYLLLASHSEAESSSARILDSSTSGDDVFISSTAKLAATDVDNTLDIYDLRVGGGFPAPPSPSTPCDPAADECQGTPTPPPGAPSPGTDDLSGSGNPPVSNPKPHPKRCRKDKVRRHGKCVKRNKRAAGHNKRNKRAAGHNRGGAK